MSGVTTGWTDSQIDEFARFAKQSGLKLDDGFINMLKASNQFVTDSQASFNDAGEFSAQAFETGLNNILPYLEGMNSTTNGSGKNIGTNLADGVAVGIKRNEYKAINAAVNMVKRAITKAQKAGDIQSPSRKMASMVGKPLAEGVGVGFDSEIKKVVQKVQIGIGNITSGGGKVVRQPAHQTIAKNNTITQNINFTSRPLSPYQQQLQTRRLSKELAGAFN